MRRHLGSPGMERRVSLLNVVRAAGITAWGLVVRLTRFRCMREMRQLREEIGTGLMLEVRSGYCEYGAAHEVPPDVV